MAVHTLNTKTAPETKPAPDGLAAVPSPPTLAERLAEAERAAEAPARRVAELDLALRAALERSDYSSAETLKNELADARTEHGIAAAAVSGLRGAIAEVDRQKAEDSRVIQAQRQADAARRLLADARRLEREALDELDSEIALTWAGVAAVRRAYLHCLELEQSAGHARAEQIQARVALGEVEPGMRAVTPNKASVLQDQFAVIREVLKWAP